MAARPWGVATLFRLTEAEGRPEGVSLLFPRLIGVAMARGVIKAARRPPCGGPEFWLLLAMMIQQLMMLYHKAAHVSGSIEVMTARKPRAWEHNN